MPAAGSSSSCLFNLVVLNFSSLLSTPNLFYLFLLINPRCFPFTLMKQDFIRANQLLSHPSDTWLLQILLCRKKNKKNVEPEKEPGRFGERLEPKMEITKYPMLRPRNIYFNQKHSKNRFLFNLWSRSQLFLNLWSRSRFIFVTEAVQILPGSSTLFIL